MPKKETNPPRCCCSGCLAEKLSLLLTRKLRQLELDKIVPFLSGLGESPKLQSKDPRGGVGVNLPLFNLHRRKPPVADETLRTVGKNDGSGGGDCGEGEELVVVHAIDRTYIWWDCESDLSYPTLWYFFSYCKYYTRNILKYSSRVC